MTFCSYSFKKIYLFLEEKVFLKNYFKFFLSKLIAKPWIRIRIQTGPKSTIRIQIQCIWIHNTDCNICGINKSWAEMGNILLFSPAGKGYISNMYIYLIWRPRDRRVPPIRDRHTHNTLLANSIFYSFLHYKTLRLCILNN